MLLYTMTKKSFKLFALLFFTLLSAHPLKANDPDVYYNLGVVSSSNEYSDYTEYGRTFFIGFGISQVFENNLFFALDINFDYIDIDSRRMSSEDNIANSAEIKLGYNYRGALTYLLGGVRVMSNDQDYYGFGKGVGVEYKVFKKLVLGFEYKVYEMQGLYFTYKYNTTGFNIKILY